MIDPSNPRILATSAQPLITYEKMSKSKYNGINPNEIISKHGADSTRLHILYKAPVSEVLEWEDISIVGIQRWLNRVWRAVCSVVESNDTIVKEFERKWDIEKMSIEERNIYRVVNATLKEVNQLIENCVYILSLRTSNNVFVFSFRLQRHMMPLIRSIQLFQI